ncbi:MAG TPA: DNA-formamidopyrimidine glycosylase family protein [Candidatus Acidoferrales bacterium]|nr:DNA-formamidopyrimidine glycosylase family protein [Candidatus Acidoferrales bacterium]
MPEGDTIWRTAAALRERLVGRRVESARPESLKHLEGRTVLAVEPAGKHLLMRFDSGLSLHTHLRMNGSWHLYRPGERWLKPERAARAVLETSEAVAVCFNAPTVELVRNPAERIGHLGPDILTESWSAPKAVRRARALGDLPLGELLLDQRVAAGIGNFFKCEALWEMSLDPWARASSLDEAGLAGLYETARDKLRQGLRRRRSAAVHGRGGRPCPRCGARIAVKAQGEHARLTYFCPRCQMI